MGRLRTEALHSTGQKVSLCHQLSLLVFPCSLPCCQVPQISGAPPVPQLHLQHHLLPQVIQLFPLVCRPLPAKPQPSSSLLATIRHSSGHHTEPSNTSQPFTPSGDKPVFLKHVDPLPIPLCAHDKGNRYLLKLAKYIPIHFVLFSSGPPWEIGICVFFSSPGS